MCLITEQLKPRVLKRNKTVYKVLHSGNFSLYYTFLWQKNKVKEQPMSTFSVNTSEVYRGNFTFADDLAADRYNNKTKNLLCVQKGFHAYLTFERARRNERWQRIHEFIIPKGAEVYTDKTGLIVANKMMLVK